MGPGPSLSPCAALLPSSAHRRRERGGGLRRGCRSDLPRILVLPTLAVQPWTSHSTSLSTCFLICNMRLKISNWLQF